MFVRKGDVRIRKGDVLSVIMIISRVVPYNNDTVM